MRSATGSPRRRSNHESTRSSNRDTAARHSSGSATTATTVPGEARSDGAGGQQLAGPGRVAPPGRAVGPERAPVAQRGDPVTEVVALAGALDRLPDGGRALLEAADRLLGRLGDDRQRLAEIEELDAGRPPPQHLLAEEGVEVDAAQPALLVVDLRGSSRFVVGDD